MSTSADGSQRQKVSSGSPYEPVIGFSRAVRVGNVVHVSGTGPVLPEGGCPDGPFAQTQRAFEIAVQALRDLGGDVEHVVRTRMFMTRAEDWEEIGRAHGTFFGEVRPAATMVVIKELLDPAWLIEVEVEAVLD
jgi:enamine deaminase RidA (YjgF/YER057c/UK114 family)